MTLFTKFIIFIYIGFFEMILIENLRIHCLYQVDVYFILPLIFYASLGYILTYNNVVSEFTQLWVSKGFRFTNVWRYEEGDYIAKWCWHKVGYVTKNASKGFSIKLFMH